MQQDRKSLLRKQKLKTDFHPDDVLNIDGREVEWHVFKKKFIDDKPKDLLEAEFLLNQDQPDERRIFWHYRSQFEMEDPTHPEAIFKRVERKYLREQKAKHGNTIYLKKRTILPFEIVMIESLGGR